MISKGSTVEKNGVRYVVVSISKTGVVRLGHLSGGFAMYSHVTVCREVV